MFWSVAFKGRNHIYLIRQQIVAEPLWILKSDKTCILRWPFSKGNKAKIHHQQKVVEFSVVLFGVRQRKKEITSIRFLESHLMGPRCMMLSCFVWTIAKLTQNVHASHTSPVSYSCTRFATLDTSEHDSNRCQFSLASDYDQFPKQRCVCVCVCVCFVRIRFVLAFFCELTANRTHYFITLLCSKSLISCESLRIVFYRAQLFQRKKESKLNRSMVGSRLKPLWLILLVLKAKLFNISNFLAFL